jgi:glycosyltransferase involved in cell wall biosynthesis
MRVALIVPGGVDRTGEQRVIPCVLALIKRLAARVDLQVFALRQEPKPSRYSLLGATVHNAGAPFSRLRTVRRLLAEHRGSSFDILHALWVGGPGVVAAAARRVVAAPVLLHIAGGELVQMPEIEYGGDRGLHRRILLQWALASADCITATSSSVRRSAELRGYRTRRLTLGVDLDTWPARSPRPRSDRHARLVHVASLNRVKDQTTLLEAVARLRNAGVDFHLDIVGEDTLGGAMQRLRDRLGLAKRVSFHGVVPHRDLRPLVERADIMLLSSRHEAGPVVLLEAAIAGVPTVGTAVGQIADWAPSAAVAVPVGDPEALARSVKELLEDDARRCRIAGEAQGRALAEDADWTASTVMDVYEKLLAARE